MRHLGVALIFLFVLVACQNAAPQNAAHTLSIPAGFQGEVRPALGRLSLQYGPHENVALEAVITYKETRRGKTETHQETYKFTSSAKRVGKTLMWKIDFTEVTSPGAKTVQEMTDAELSAELDYAIVAADGDTTGLPLSHRISPGAGARLIAVKGALLRLRMLTSPKGRLKDIAIEEPGYTSVGGRVIEPSSKKNDDLAKQARKKVSLVFSEGAVGMGDKLYSATPFSEFIRLGGRAPEWIVVGLTTHKGRPSVLASVADTIRIQTAEGDIPVYFSGYSVVDLETGLSIGGTISATAGAGGAYSFVVKLRWSAAF